MLYLLFSNLTNMIPKSRIKLVEYEFEEESWMIEGCPELDHKFIEMLESLSRAELRQLTKSEFVQKFQEYPKKNVLVIFNYFIVGDLFGLLGGHVKFAVLNMEDPYDFNSIDSIDEIEEK